MPVIQWPKLPELKSRAMALPQTPFKYHFGVYTSCICAYFPNPQKAALDWIEYLQNNSGDRRKWPIYLELYELITEYERSIFS